MASRYKASYAQRLVNNYIAEIERQKASIDKNFRDMDFENADARDEFEDKKNSMINECDNLINLIKAYKFY